MPAFPPGIGETHPRDLSAEEIRRAPATLARLLGPYSAGDLGAPVETARRRLALLTG
jgi:hypothetical protein